MMWEVVTGDAITELRWLSSGSVHLIVTSPPYHLLRRYLPQGHPDADLEIGTEPRLSEYLAHMVLFGAAAKRVLRPDGNMFLNIADRYHRPDGGGYHLNGKQRSEAGLIKRIHQAEFGLKAGDMCLIPERLKIALQDQGWYVRNTIVWAKMQCIPEAVENRATQAWEPVVHLTRSTSRYFYDATAVREPSTNPDRHRSGLDRNQRNVWLLNSENGDGEHSAPFPTEIPRRAILAGTSERGCCPACGAPWIRILEKQRLIDGQPAELGAWRPKDGRTTSTAQGVGHHRISTERRTLDWKPTCAATCPGHEQDPIPCTVLDPFAGSGTTGEVAIELGRSFVGIELNPEYAEMARRRIQNAHESVDATAGPLFTPEAEQLSLTEPEAPR